MIESGSRKSTALTAHVAGCHANVECRVVNEFTVEGLYLFVGEALASYVDDQVPPVARLAGKTFRLDGPI
jgi:flavin reductase (DIM6/NTAB) family NADH-FMN oxidoreductase RutF